ncbi:MAG: GNAT family N-acetyltransferase [Myxococcota bacterium]
MTDRVVRARPEHVACLPAIERAAGSRFREVEFLDDDVGEGDETSLEEFHEAQRAGQLWVALCDDAVVGFALAHRHGDRAHLEEVDVHPDHGRRGLGARLVRAVCDWARGAGFAELTLTTFREVPWNAPFYRGQGFEEIPDAELPTELREIVEEEALRGLDPERRVVMRWPARKG